ncbi:PKD domain-containing protein [bacterium]|nr:PKD domain-containing protein [bacterium]
MKKLILIAIPLFIVACLFIGCGKTAKSTNKAPVINSFTPSFTTACVSPDTVIKLTVNFSDPDITGTLPVSDYTFQWTARSIEPADVQFNEKNNFLIDDDATCYWRTPEVQGYYELIVEIRDRYDEPVIGGYTLLVSDNTESPIIDSFTASFSGSTIGANEVIEVTVNFHDPDISGDPNPDDYDFLWTAIEIEPGSLGYDPNDNFLIRDAVTCYWRTPDVQGFYQLIVEIKDRFNDTVLGSFTFEVSDNKSPVISNIDVSNPIPQTNEPITITVTADDPDGNLPLTYEWSASKGYFTQEADNSVEWVSASTGDVTITVKVYDALGAYVEKKIYLSVQSNSDPVIDGYDIDATRPETGQIVNVSVTAHDPDGDELSYDWSASGGSFQSINSNIAVWIAPLTTGNYSITITVDDSNGGEDEIVIPVEVIEPPL